MSQTRPIDEHSMHTRTCGELRRESFTSDSGL